MAARPRADAFPRVQRSPPGSAGVPALAGSRLDVELHSGTCMHARAHDDSVLCARCVLCGALPRRCAMRAALGAVWCFLCAGRGRCALCDVSPASWAVIYCTCHLPSPACSLLSTVYSTVHDLLPTTHCPLPTIYILSKLDCLLSTGYCRLYHDL